MEEYFAAKALLFDGRCRYEVINLDDRALRPLLKPATITYSAAGDPAATWRAEQVEPAGYGQRFRALGPGGLALDAAVALPGRHNVANALLALATLVAAGVEAEVAAHRHRRLPGGTGPVGAGRRPRAGDRGRRLRAQAGRDRRRAGRAAGVGATGAADLRDRRRWGPGHRASGR